MAKTYVTDITHFLDKNGALAEMPGPVRKMASFLVLLIDATTQACPARDFNTHIRCRTIACRGSIRTSLASRDEEIAWYCPECQHNGVIRNWRETKWDQRRQGALGD